MDPTGTEEGGGSRMKGSTAILIFAVLAISTVACASSPGAMPETDVTAIKEYVDCVNSRFPLPATRGAYVTADSVAQEIARENLDMPGMALTFRSLGCGLLSAPTGESYIDIMRRERVNTTKHKILGYVAIMVFPAVFVAYGVYGVYTHWRGKSQRG